MSGGDAAATYPVQAAAGFLAQLDEPVGLTARPFSFPSRHRDALQLVKSNVRSFATTSMGRLFDAAAALLGFTREATFEGQAVIRACLTHGETTQHDIDELVAALCAAQDGRA